MFHVGISTFQSGFKRRGRISACGGKFGTDTFFQRNNVNLSCHTDKDCQKEKERALEDECMLMLSLTTLHDEK